MGFLEIGQTPLAEEEKDDLLIRTITTRSELDEFEQLNIESAKQWVYTNRFSANKIFNQSFMKILLVKCFVIFGSGLVVLGKQTKT